MYGFEDPSRPHILALDLDGTVLSYDGNFDIKKFGQVVKGMVEELTKLKDAGWAIVIWTCRPDSEDLRNHLNEQGIPFDYVNGHPWAGNNSPKLFADVYVDDNCLRFDGVSDGLSDCIMSHKPWWRFNNQI